MLVPASGTEPDSESHLLPGSWAPSTPAIFGHKRQQTCNFSPADVFNFFSIENIDASFFYFLSFFFSFFYFYAFFLNNNNIIFVWCGGKGKHELCIIWNENKHLSWELTYLQVWGKGITRLERIPRKSMKHWLGRKTNASSSVLRILRIWTVRMSHTMVMFRKWKSNPTGYYSHVHDYFMGWKGTVYCHLTAWFQNENQTIE